MLEKKIIFWIFWLKFFFHKINLKKFSNIGRFIYQNVQNQISRDFQNECFCPWKKLFEKNRTFQKIWKFEVYKSKTKRWEQKVRLNFSRFCFTLSVKDILVGHIFSLWSKNGERQIIDKFFFDLAQPMESM